MQNLDDVFKLLRDVESAVRRSGWKGGGCSRPCEVRHIAERYGNGDFHAAEAVIKAHRRGALTPAPAAAPAAPDGLADLINACPQIGFPVVSDEMKPAIDAMQAALRKVRHSLANTPPAPDLAGHTSLSATGVTGRRLHPRTAEQSPEVAISKTENTTQCELIGYIDLPNRDHLRHGINATINPAAEGMRSRIPVFIGQQSPRITELDALAIAESFQFWSDYHFIENMFVSWLDEEGRDLIDKLNTEEA